MKAKDYRADIDVLRAIAVLAVVFNHAHIPFFNGGYVGVSIFFVISGYLISRIIKNKVETNTFSFLEFYENRIRRILPALFFVVITTIYFFYTFGTREDLYYLQRSLKRVILGLANIFYYTNTNYFDPAAEQIPLLHTWSLGVEEQFYFIMPALLYFLAKFKHIKTTNILFILFGISFVSSCILLPLAPKFTFYMLPTRVWELLLGCILAYTEWTPKSQKNKARCILLGLALMLSSITLYGDNSFPGFWALFPCFGAFLYIAGGTNYTFTNKFNLIHSITNNGILIFIGVISYSLYLWHWPLLIFYRYIAIQPLTLPIFLLLFVGMIIISTLSWRFIEQPVRRHKFFKNRKLLWIITIICIGSFIIISSELRRAKTNIIYSYSISSLNENYNEKYDNTKPKFIVIGDSHADSNKDMINELAKEYNVYGIHCTLTNLVGSYKNDKDIVTKEINPIKETLHHNTIDNAFIIMRLNEEYSGKARYYDKNEKAKDYIYVPNPKLSPDNAFIQSMRDTVNLLTDNGVKNIYIQMPLPEPKFYVPQYGGALKLIYNYSTDKINTTLSETLEEYHSRTEFVNSVLELLHKENPNIKLINPLPAMQYKDNYFVTVSDDIAYYYDDDHLSVESSKLLKSTYEEIFKTFQ